MTADESPAMNAASMRIDEACRVASAGRSAGRTIAAWARAFELGEPELQLLWCLHQDAGEGVDQTTIAQRLVFSPAQVSSLVERLRKLGWIEQRPMASDRRRHLWRLSGEGQ